MSDAYQYFNFGFKQSCVFLGHAWEVTERGHKCTRCGVEGFMMGGMKFGTDPSIPRGEMHFRQDGRTVAKIVDVDMEQSISTGLITYHCPQCGRESHKSQSVSEFVGIGVILARCAACEPSFQSYARSPIVLTETPTCANPEQVFQVEVSSTWTCDRHAPGSEVRDIPVGEKCPVCLRSQG